MTRLHETPEDLVALARRVTLSQDEQQALQEQLAKSETLRAALSVGRDFDRIAGMQAGDEARVARFVTGALRSRTRLRSRFWPKSRLSPWMLAAAVLGFSGVAFGLRGLWIPVVSRHYSGKAASGTPPEKPRSEGRRLAATPREAPPAETSAVITPDSTLPVASVAPGPHPVVPVATASESPVAIPRSDAPASPEPSVSAGALVAGASTAIVIPEPSEPTAALLFASANLSRNRGRFDLAMVQFRELQRRFGGSPEAVMSLVSLGKLLLARHDASAAFDQFSTYLRVGGPLMEEAMVGRAQALSLLGRTSEEARAWQIFLTQFPRSVYAGQARQRLVALGGQSR